MYIYCKAPRKSYPDFYHKSVDLDSIAINSVAFDKSVRVIYKGSTVHNDTVYRTLYILQSFPYIRFSNATDPVIWNHVWCGRQLWIRIWLIINDWLKMISSFWLTGAELRIDTSLILPSLVQIMVCRLVRDKPVSEPMLEYCWHGS